MTASVDLSKMTKLKDVAFRVSSWSVGWITMALRTVTPKHRDIRTISIFAVDHSTLFDIVNADLGGMAEEETLEWLELDRLLAQLWGSHSIRPKILYNAFSWNEGMICDWVGRLLPETTERGILDLARAW